MNDNDYHEIKLWVEVGVMLTVWVLVFGSIVYTIINL